MIDYFYIMVSVALICLTVVLVIYKDQLISPQKKEKETDSDIHLSQALNKEVIIQVAPQKSNFQSEQQVSEACDDSNLKEAVEWLNSNRSKKTAGNDGGSLFIMPGISENLGRSIKKQVAPQYLEKHFKEEDYKKIIEIYGSTPIHCWAVSERKQSLFSALNHYSIFLFKENASSNVSYKARFMCKFCSKTFGEFLWGDKKWSYIIFLKEVEKCNIPAKKLKKELGFEENYWFPSAIRVNKNSTENLIKKYGSLEDFLSQINHQAGAK